MIDVFGWLSSLLFCICGAPQAYLSFREKTSAGISTSFLLLWIGGELLGIIYILPKNDYPILINYLINLIFISIILYYKVIDKLSSNNNDLI